MPETGKFHGAMTPMTPRGTISTRALFFGKTSGFKRTGRCDGVLDDAGPSPHGVERAQRLVEDPLDLDLPHLGARELDELPAAREHPLAGALQRGHAIGERAKAPVLLRRASLRDGVFDLFDGGDADRLERAAVVGRYGVDLLRLRLHVLGVQGDRLPVPVGMGVAQSGRTMPRRGARGQCPV